jgi:hypothetical protein
MYATCAWTGSGRRWSAYGQPPHGAERNLAFAIEVQGDAFPRALLALFPASAENLNGVGSHGLASIFGV